MLARDFERRQPIARLQHAIAVRFEEIVEELHIELVVLDDQNGLGLRRVCCEHLLGSHSLSRYV